MGRKPQVTSELLRNFASGRPNSAFPSSFSYVAGTTSSSPVFYNSTIISTPERRTGFMNAPALLYSMREFKTTDVNWITHLGNYYQYTYG
jgi:hypothetical protein